MAPLYFDHNATTPLLREAGLAMEQAAAAAWGNPASQHAAGRSALHALDAAKTEILQKLGAQTEHHPADRLIVTSGGTEANYLALLGVARSYGAPAEAIISAIEHPSLRGGAEELERIGWLVHKVRVDRQGVIDLDHLQSLLSAQTRLVSLMLANNETGAVQPVAAASSLCRAAGVLLHCDASQAVGKMPVDFGQLGVDLLTFSPHKFHGPVGVGGLIVRAGVILQPIMAGGLQQLGLRGGTEPVPLVVGVNAALPSPEGTLGRAAHLRERRDAFESRLQQEIPGLVIHCQQTERVPSTSNVAFPGCERQQLLMALDLEGIACSSGSACASGSSQPSPVLQAMGCAEELVRGSLRFSFGLTTTQEEIDDGTARIVKVWRRLAR